VGPLNRRPEVVRHRFGIATSLRHSADFRRLWIARVVSIAGSSVTVVVFPVLLFKKSNLALLTVLPTVALALPFLLFGPIAGVVADRYDRRRLMLLSSLGCGVAVASVPVSSAFGGTPLWQVAVVIIVVGSLNVFFDAASFAGLPTLVGRPHIARGNSKIWSATIIVNLVVASGTGAILPFVTAEMLIIADAVSYLVAAIFLLSIRGSMGPLAVPTGARLQVVKNFKRGIAFLARHPQLSYLTTLGTATVVTGASVLGLLVVFAASMGITPDDSRLGILFGANGFGSFLGATLLPHFSSRLPPTRLNTLGAGACGVVIVGMALTGQWLVAVPGLLIWSCLFTIVNVSGISARQALTPDGMQGTVNMSGRLIVHGFGQSAGAFVAGALTDSVNVTVALTLCTVPTFVVVLARLVPRLWPADPEVARQPQPERPPPVSGRHRRNATPSRSGPAAYREAA
jgi:MFS family permease